MVATASGKTTVFPGLRGARAVGLVDGFLVYVRGDGALMAAPFDVHGLRAGTPLQIADSIAVPSSAWDAPVALSANGSLLYQHGGTASQLVSVDPHGAARVLVDSVQVYSASPAVAGWTPHRRRGAGRRRRRHLDLPTSASTPPNG